MSESNPTVSFCVLLMFYCNTSGCQRSADVVCFVLEIDEEGGTLKRGRSVQGWPAKGAKET